MATASWEGYTAETSKTYRWKKVFKKIGIFYTEKVSFIFKDNMFSLFSY